MTRENALYHETKILCDVTVMGGELFSKLVWRQLLETMLYSRHVAIFICLSMKTICHLGTYAEQCTFYVYIYMTVPYMHQI